MTKEASGFQSPNIDLSLGERVGAEELPRVTVVGFDGTSVGFVGLCTPVGRAPGLVASRIWPRVGIDDKQDWCFKLGTRSPDPITLGTFESYARGGLITKFKEPQVITYRASDRPVAAYVSEELLEAL